MAAHNTVFCPADHDGFMAVEDDAIAGLVTFVVTGTDCEITLIEAVERYSGVGTALLAAVEQAAREAGCGRVWLITTNDNVDALRFYQRRGFVLRSVHAGAVERARILKPEIPAVGDYGIPIRDEIELEKFLPQ